MLGRDNQMAFDIFGNQKKEFKSANTARNTFYWPDNLKQSNIVWRLPSNVRWNDNIVVREDEFAVFLRDGKALCVFDRVIKISKNVILLDKWDVDKAAK